MYAQVRRRLANLTWLQLTLLWAGAIYLLWGQWRVGGLNERIVRDTVLYILLPTSLALTHGKNLGWRVDRRVLRNTVLLGAFVVPFYVVGSSLPSVRAYYPMWHTSAALGEYLPHTAKQLVVVVAAETYYRGLLCVGVREIGFKSVFISPVVYAIRHMSKPPIELILSGPTDVLFGAVDYESNSILPSIVAHGLGLALLDWLVMHPPLIPAATVLEWLSWLPVQL